jgi:hypothetical protein
MKSVTNAFLSSLRNFQHLLEPGPGGTTLRAGGFPSEPDAGKTNPPGTTFAAGEYNFKPGGTTTNPCGRTFVPGAKGIFALAFIHVF